METKRGQFYLISAVVIIIVLIGYVVVSNYSRITGYSKTYDLAEELEIERANVLDYGTYNENIEIEQMQNFLEGFIEGYSEVGETQELYFIFGNYEEIVFMGYQQLQEEVIINVKIDKEEYHPLQIEKQSVKSQTFIGKEDIRKVKILISEDEYAFHLKKGENFYFILSQVFKGEKYVIVG
jgi:hypothetical protein